MEILRSKIPKNIYQRLEIAEINSLDYFLIKPKREICDKTKLTEQDATRLVKIVSEIVLKNDFMTAASIKSHSKLWTVISTGCPIIDDAIKSIPTRGITEIFGESGAGKTQIALQLSLNVQNPEENGGLNAGAVYICSEDIFPSKRLHQMSNYLPKLINNHAIKSYADGIFIETVEDVEQLKYCLNIRLPVLLSKSVIKLIIIDSIAGAFRFDNETMDYITRSEDLREIALKIYNLSSHYNLSVVCINQVSSDENSE